MQRVFTNILCKNVAETAKFYENLLGMQRHFDSDWFVILTHPDVAGLEYGILQRDHESVPEGAQTTAGGVIVTFVVEDCDQVYSRAQEIGARIISKPTDMFYGQRRMLLNDPEGTVIDVSAPTAPLIEG